MKAIQIPDWSRASLAPYLPIPYGTLKLVGMELSLICAIVVISSFALLGGPTMSPLVALLFVVIFGLIHRIAERDVDGFESYGWTAYQRAYWNRNWHGYRLWVYKEGEEYKYWVLRAGMDLDHPVVKVAVCIPLHRWIGVPTYWVKDAPLVPRPFHLRLKHRSFNGVWCVVVADYFGNRLTLPVEMALELGLTQVQDTSELPYTARQFDLANNFLAVCKDWKWQKESGKLAYYRFVDSLRTIEKAIEMIRASTRFQRSKEGKAIREFLEIRYLMIANNESEEEARKRMLESA